MRSAVGILVGAGLAILGLGIGCGSDDTASGGGKGGGAHSGGGSGGTGASDAASGGKGGSGGSGASGGSSGSAGSGGASGADGGPSCTNPPTDVTIQPSDDIQAAVDAHPEGTKFLLAAGVFRGASVSPKQNDEFYGELDASCKRLTTLNGSRELGNLTQQGSVWMQAGQTQEGQVHGQCETGWERCDRPEDLFIDGVPQKHVSALSAVGAGSWFFDYAADTVYVGDDPTGHVVEVGDQRVAFAPSADGVTVANLIIEKYSIPAQMGAVGDQYPKNGWHVENNEVRLNHGTGINVSSNSVVSGNFVHDNGQKGVGAGGDAVLYEKNEISLNNYAHFDAGWEAGGSKFSNTTNLVVRKNCVHDNYGPGLWTDIDNHDVTYDGNVVFSNQSMGIFHEISYAAVIENNIVGDNGKDFAWLYGSQILISTSQDADVHDNVVEVPASYGNGIGVIWQDRPPHQATGNKLHANDVTFLADGPVWQNTPAVTGVAADFAPATTDAFTSNSMDGDKFHMLDTGTDHFAWDNGTKTFAELQAAGQEATGSVDSAVVPKTWSCALVQP